MYYSIPKQASLGLTLIEVLIATLILSAGFLAISRLQLLSLRYTQSAYLSSFAEVQLFTMAECLQLSQWGHGCQQEKAEWERRLAVGLPGGIGKIYKKPLSYQVIVAWNNQWVGHLGNSCPNGIPSQLTCVVLEVAL